MEAFEIPPPEDLLVGTEEHPEGQHRICIEFYKAPDDSYFVWPRVKRLRGDCASSKHFQLLGHFANMDAARQAAVNKGRSLISAGFDTSQID